MLPAVCWAQTETFPHNNGPAAFSSINNTVYVDGVKYPATQAGISAALVAACTGAIPGKVVLPLGTVSINGQITVSSANCTVEGSGRFASVIQESGNSAPLAVGPVSHVRLINFGVDGGRSDNGGSNSSSFDCIDVGSNAADVLLDGVRASNCRNQGIIVASGDKDVTIQNSETDHDGNGSLASPGTGGITIAAGSGTMSRILVGPNNRIHDNNGGVIVTNSSVAADVSSDISVFENLVYANGNDGILATATFGSGGPILNFSAKGNRVFCNGWPANGTGFSSACTAGFLQTGSSSSPQGVAVDLITNGDKLVLYPIVSGNSLHDNVFEGVAVTSNVTGTVTVSGGTTVTQTFGSTFNTNWKAGQTISIETVLYKIASVDSATTLTLATSATNGVSQGVNLPTYFWASVVGNEIYGNGSNVESPIDGPGIYCQLADGNSFGQNVVRLNNLEGLELYGCSFTTSIGDKSYSNDTGATAGRNDGFAVYGGLADQFLGDVADDPVASPTQTIGLKIDANSTNTLVDTKSLYGSSSPVSDSGSMTSSIP